MGPARKEANPRPALSADSWTSSVRAVDDADVFAFLDRHGGEARALYWCDGAGHAGAGVAAELHPSPRARFQEARIGAAALLSQLRVHRGPGVPTDVGPIWFSASSFEPDAIDSDFPANWTFLPREQLTVRNGRAFRITTVAAQPSPAATTPAAPAAAGAWTPRPPFDEWATSVRKALGALREGQVEKVVLARMLHGPQQRPSSLVQLARRLARSSPTSRTLLFEPRPGHAWIAATPELLVRRSQDRVHTVALAGSRPRGRTPEEDARLERSLLSASKDAWEHEIVARTVRAALSDRPYPWSVLADRAVLKLPYVQHLETRFEAATGSDEHILDLVESLHPTPATAGHPREAAMRLLAELEKGGRGWYAAPLGWFDAAGDGEFSVNLRCARWTPQGIDLVAGCGLVEGSDPVEEWEESRSKMSLLQTLLDGGAP